MKLKTFNKEKEYKKLQRNSKVKITYITSLFSVCAIAIVVTFILTNSFAFKSSDSFTLINATVANMFTYQNFTYTGNAQEFIVPHTGYYNIELWGAQGGGNIGGYGSYTSGTVYLEKNEKIYLYIGGPGMVFNLPSVNHTNGWNGGGGDYYQATAIYNVRGSGGGGATDIRLTSGAWNNITSLRSRIMVAGAGGGYGGLQTTRSGNAGGLIGNEGGGSASVCGSIGGSQTSGGTYKCAPNTANGAFGGGGTHDIAWATVTGTGGGGGSGYYGGGGGVGTTYDGQVNGSGGGGSSFISGHNGCNAINTAGAHTGTANHYSGKVFTNTKMIDGSGYSWTNVKGSLEQMPNPAGGYYPSGVGHSGNGYARITFV